MTFFENNINRSKTIFKIDNENSHNFCSFFWIFFNLSALLIQDIKSGTSSTKSATADDILGLKCGKVFSSIYENMDMIIMHIKILSIIYSALSSLLSLSSSIWLTLPNVFDGYFLLIFWWFFRVLCLVFHDIDSYQFDYHQGFDAVIEKLFFILLSF